MLSMLQERLTTPLEKLESVSKSSLFVRVLKSLIEGMFLRALACLLKLRWASILQRLLKQKVLALWAKQHALRGVSGYRLVVALIAMLS